jgi:hypothetical protein
MSAVHVQTGATAATISAICTMIGCSKDRFYTVEGIFIFRFQSRLMIFLTSRLFSVFLSVGRSYNLGDLAGVCGLRLDATAVASFADASVTVLDAAHCLGKA